ncbi:alpha/beta-hydrolase [Stereum hirsutum FP-91666 SS1]|uniref:alpha/beta-hydrolase n=1 Tax=Stereum hirsutum (strain FP-91666) TaxID=721885 RepID=UPI000444971D|nr:alpha/beta-hydrolase [Stereum hirsutum FP-91666 SS1]EIM86130.1 alpha/beta-hydrolase [Stereum hirsutum FP-91666 SS1]
MSSPFATRRSTKVSIPHTGLPGVNLVGILEQVEPNAATRGRRIALILHGTMGHKDYIFQKRLALRLPIDSFRFDFRGTHESGGTWRQTPILNDVEDIRVVAAFLSSRYGYHVDLVVGHSRGANVGIYWCCMTEEGRSVSAFVNVSGRYRMEVLSSFVLPVDLAAFAPSIAQHDYYDWHTTIARKPFVGRIYPGEIEECMRWDSSIVWDKFPGHIDVLTIHGLADITVPPYDATIYARAFGGREGSGTHNLAFVENADHNYVAHGCRDEATEIILLWWDLHEKKLLTTGVMGSEVTRPQARPLSGGNVPAHETAGRSRL